MRAALAALVCSLGVVAAGAIYLLSPLPVPAQAAPDIDLARARALADERRGALPLQVGVLRVAESAKPAAAVIGGLRLGRTLLVWTTFQIRHADSSIVVDAAWHAERSPGERFDTAAFAALQRGLRAAEQIVVTHEHPDHMGGLRDAELWSEIRGRIRLTSAQLANRNELTRVLRSEQVASLRPLDYRAMHWLAPGVVLIAAPGHTQGSQLVYVRLADRRELLLVGDVAWDAAQIATPLGRTRIASWLLGEDAERVGRQLRALHHLAQEPGIRVVPSHDGALLDELVAGGWLAEGFE